MLSTQKNWTWLLFLLLSLPSGSWCCSWLQHSYEHLNTVSLRLLRDMGGEFTKEETPVKFRYSLYRRVLDAQLEEKVWFLNETTYQMERLFDGNMQTVTWDMTKLHHFRNILHRQFDNLKSCVSAQRRPDRRVRRYFRKLHRNILRKMNYSAQAWEIIRNETHRLLVRLTFLARKTY